MKIKPSIYSITLAVILLLIIIIGSMVLFVNPDNSGVRKSSDIVNEQPAGMLFMMGTEEMQAFWMKNTIIPLDILYADSERRIVSIHKNTTPYSLDQIQSDKPALYVVEVNAGYTDRQGIVIGDFISF